MVVLELCGLTSYMPGKKQRACSPGMTRFFFFDSRLNVYGEQPVYELLNTLGLQIFSRDHSFQHNPPQWCPKGNVVTKLNSQNSLPPVQKMLTLMYQNQKFVGKPVPLTWNPPRVVLEDYNQPLVEHQAQPPHALPEHPSLVCPNLLLREPDQQQQDQLLRDWVLPLALSHNKTLVSNLYWMIFLRKCKPLPKCSTSNKPQLS